MGIEKNSDDSRNLQEDPRTSEKSGVNPVEDRTAELIAAATSFFPSAELHHPTHLFAQPAANSDSHLTPGHEFRLLTADEWDDAITARHAMPSAAFVSPQPHEGLKHVATDLYEALGPSASVDSSTPTSELEAPEVTLAPPESHIPLTIPPAQLQSTPLTRQESIPPPLPNQSKIPAPKAAEISVVAHTASKVSFFESLHQRMMSFRDSARSAMGKYLLPRPQLTPTVQSPLHSWFQRPGSRKTVAALLFLGLAGGYGMTQVSQHEKHDNIPDITKASPAPTKSTPVITQTTPTRSTLTFNRTSGASAPEQITHRHEIKLRNDGMPATLASAIKGYMLRDFRMTHPGYRLARETTDTLTDNFLATEAGTAVSDALHGDVRIGDSFTFGTMGDRIVVLEVHRNGGQNLLREQVMLDVPGVAS